jgi:hypothetical protein
MQYSRAACISHEEHNVFIHVCIEIGIISALSVRMVYNWNQITLAVIDMSPMNKSWVCTQILPH